MTDAPFTETHRLAARLRELATDIDTQIGIMGRMNVSEEDSRLLREAADEIDARERIIELYERQLTLTEEERRDLRAARIRDLTGGTP